MAPAITPHRFLSSLRQAGSSQKPTQDVSNNASQPPSNTQRSSQFANTPRFSKNRLQHVSQSAPSQNLRRDVVEESDDLDQIYGLKTASSPLVQRSKGRPTREPIEIDLDDDEDDFRQPESKRRKIPLPPTPSWSNHVNPTPGSELHVRQRRSPIDDTEQAITPPRAIREALNIQSSSPGTDEQPAQTTPVSRPSTSTWRSAPRFRFEGVQDTASRVASTSSHLQRITGTSPFVFSDTNTSTAQDEANNLANTNLALLFSPQKHRRYQYVPGGMASTVRDWVLEAGAGIMSDIVAAEVRVLSARACERGSHLVLGVDKLGEEEHYLLMATPQTAAENMFEIDKLVRVFEPSWTIEMDRISCRVGVKWQIVDDG